MDNPKGELSTVESLKRDYGLGFLSVVLSSNGLLKGALYALVMKVQIQYYTEIGASQHYPIMVQVATIPWSLKSLYGTLSDAWPLFGYYKRSWILLLSLWGLGGLCLLAFSEYEEPTGSNYSITQFAVLPPISVTTTALCFTGIATFIAMTDCVVQGKVSEMMNSGCDSSIMTVGAQTMTVGALGMALVIGPLGDVFDAKTQLWSGLIIAAVAILPILLGYLPEEKQESCRPQLAKVASNFGTFFLATFQSMAAIGLAALLLLTQESPRKSAYKMGYCFCSGSISVILAYAVFSGPEMRPIANCNLYVFLSTVLYFGFDALDIWMMGPESCVKDGPAFDKTYYLSIIGVTGAAAALMGQSVYNAYFKDWTIRKAFWVTALFKCIASLSDVVVVERWNLLLGVSDWWAYLIGTAILTFVIVLNMMPGLFLVPKLCPKGMEATVFAIVISTANLASAIASLLGGELLDAVGVKLHTREGSMKDTPCNDDNLGAAVLAGHVILPLITIPLTFWLVPDVRIDEDMERESTEVTDEGYQTLGDRANEPNTFATARAAYAEKYSFPAMRREVELAGRRHTEGEAQQSGGRAPPVRSV